MPHSELALGIAERDPLSGYFRRLGDDALVVGQRLAEWCGHAPTLEIDLGLTNISLDCFGHAALLLNAAAGGPDGGDRLAFERDVLDFENCLLTEQPNGDFGRTVARQLLFSQWQILVLRALQSSGDAVLADFAPKAEKEVSNHLAFAAEWASRLGDGTEESRRRLSEGLSWCARFVDELFEVDPPLLVLIDQGIAADPQAIRTEYEQRLNARLSGLGLADRLDVPVQVAGGRKGMHTEHLGRLLADLQFLPRAYPGARW